RPPAVSRLRSRKPQGRGRLITARGHRDQAVADGMGGAEDGFHGADKTGRRRSLRRPAPEVGSLALLTADRTLQPLENNDRIAICVLPDASRLSCELDH